ncbi:glycosyltransferase [Dongia deserti]|uniref:glycosyltransferase n=1 Tax=Dongia deserti TaxID=2268030 RepID=UPI000E64638F|nr:glycosyltransferase [Dongia deserti]
MRIVNIIQCANLGGMEQSTLALMLVLKARGHAVELLSLNPLGAMGAQLAEQAIPAEGLPYRGVGGWRSVGQFRRRLSGRQSDALIMTGHNLLAMKALGSFCATRRILSIHFHHSGVKRRWQWRLIYRSARRRFSAIVFPSDFIRQEAEDIYPEIRPISHTVGCPISLSDIPSEAERMLSRQRLGLPMQARVIGNAGWLVPRKRFDIFLEIARRIATVDADAMFVIAGDGPEAGALRLRTVELGISDRVTWLGWQRDLRDFFRSLDLMLFNADWEALGRSPLEALAAGVPVVASVRHGGLSEILNGENYGPIYADHDIDRMTNVALSALGNRAIANRLVAAGRRRLEQVASPEGYADRVFAFLAEERKTGCGRRRQ